MHFAFDEFAHILWGVKKPTIVMTDNKAHRILPVQTNTTEIMELM